MICANFGYCVFILQIKKIMNVLSELLQNHISRVLRS